MKKVLIQVSLILLLFMPHSSNSISLIKAKNTNQIAPISTMKCMSDCIKYEGNTTNAKAICKMRCSKVHFNNVETDCMGNFKTCRKSCAKKNSQCKRTCKKALLKCN